MASKVIATVLNLKDNFSETIKKTTQNTNAFAKEVKQAESSITKLKTGITGAFSSTGAKIAGIVGGIGIAEFARESLMLASDLNEVQNVVDTTFSNSAQVINDFAKTTSSQFGMSELQAKKFSGTLGAMLKSAGFTGDELTNMSTTLTGLAGDMASFYNLNPEEAFDKLKSGISGETEPLKSLGVDISDTTVGAYAMANGFNKVWKDATQSEKELWRYKAIMNQTKDAQGDYSKTSQGFANQLRTLKLNFQTLGATIMSYAVPPLANLFVKANDFITKIDMKSFMDGFSSAIISAKPTFDNFITAFKDLGSTILQTVQPGIDWINQNVIPKNWDDVGSAINSVLTGATDVVNFIKDNWSIISPIVIAITADIALLKLSIIGVNTWAGIVAVTTSAWSTIELIIWGITNATSAWEAAQWLLNATMDANPIGAVIGLVTALGLAIYEVVVHFQEICEWAEKAWNWLTSWNNTPMENKTATVTAYGQTVDNSKDNLDTSVLSFGQNATGTRYWRGSWSMVGEHGPELINMPSGSKVYTASETQKMMNGNGGLNVYLTIQGNLLGNEEYADSIGEHIWNKLHNNLINT